MNGNRQKAFKSYSQSSMLYVNINCILINNKNIKNISLNVGNIDNILIENNASINKNNMSSFNLIYTSDLVDFFDDNNNNNIIKVYCKNLTTNCYKNTEIDLNNTSNLYIFALKTHDKETNIETWNNITLSDWNKIESLLNLKGISLSINNTILSTEQIKNTDDENYSDTEENNEESNDNNEEEESDSDGDVILEDDDEDEESVYENEDNEDDNSVKSKDDSISSFKVLKEKSESIPICFKKSKLDIIDLNKIENNELELEEYIDTDDD